MLTSILRSWNEMSTYRKVRRVISLGLLAFGIWALSPYLYSRRVDEAFPAALPVPTAMAEPTAVAGAMAEPTAMAGAMTEPTTMAGAMAEPTAVAGVMAEPTAMADVPTGPVALLRGGLVPGSTPGDTASGSATIYRLENNSQLLRLEEFSTTNGPDLFVVLSGNANPDADGIGAKGSYVQLEALKGNQGSQNYSLPADIDLSAYKSVVIWCRTFNVVFGYATLQPAT